MIKKIGKKGREWINARRKRIKELEATKRYIVIKTLLYGPCKDCSRWRCLDLDHIEGRHGKEAHAATNLDAVCRECHIKRTVTNHMQQKEDKPDKSKAKANWQKDHACKACKAIVSTLLCTICGKISI